ncbi:MAG: TlpA family protein disulfide reductase [Firmicutes bacterium]|nr:TlpA family protein disulfide reductase [Bacillota bacterium]
MRHARLVVVGIAILVVAFISVSLLHAQHTPDGVVQMSDAASGNQTAQQASSLEEKPLVNHKAPDFTAQGFDGKRYALSDLKGKVVFLNFWASWCGPCREEQPQLNQLAQRYKEDVVFVGVNATFDDTLQGARTFLSAYQVPYLELYDLSGEIVQRKYQTFGYPGSFVIDKNGIIRAIYPGQASSSAYAAAIEQALQY